MSLLASAHTCSGKSKIPDFDELQVCLRRRDDLLRRVENAATKKQCDAAVSAFLYSHATKVAAAHDSFRKRFPLKSLHLKGIFEIADKVCWQFPPMETVKAFHIPKGANGFRLVFDFGEIWRAASFALKPLLEIQLRKSERTFQFYRRGYASAIAYMISRIEGGHVWASHLDIASFYPSIEVEEFSKLLRVPTGIAGRVCAVRCAHTVWREDGHTVEDNVLTEQIRRSLPQGLPIAPFVAEIIISKLKLKKFKGVVLINFHDNFLILGKSEAAVSDAKHALRAGVEALAGGSFLLKEKSVVGKIDHDCGLEFLGHDVQMAADGLLVRPSFRADEELIGVIARYEADLHSLCTPPGSKSARRARTVKILGKLLAYGAGWKAAFSACSAVEEYIQPAQQVLKAYAAHWCVSNAELLGAVDEDAAYKFHGYS